MRGWIGAAALVLTVAGCDCDGGNTTTGGGVLVVEEKQLDFGEVCRRSADPAVEVVKSTRIVHLSNEGNALAYVNKFALDPADAQFAVDESKVPGSIAPGATVEVPIDFTPNATGNRTATLAIEGENAEQSFKLTLLGAGSAKPTEPALTLSCPGGMFGPTANGCATTGAVKPLVFFEQTVAGQAGEMTVTLTNDGCPPMEVKNLAVTTKSDVSLGKFELLKGTETATKVPGGGGKVSFKVRFLPLSGDMPADGFLSGTLTFETNDPARKQLAVALQGVGIVPLLEITPWECRFERLAAPCDGNFTLTNNSGAELTVNSVALKSGNAMFKVAQAPAAGFKLAANATAAVRVDYTPSATAAEDKLVVDWSGGPVTARLTGGSPPVAYVDPSTSLDFGDQDRYKVVSVDNVETWARQLPLTIASIELTTDSPAFDLPASPPDPVACPPAPAANTKVAVGQGIKACVHFKAGAGSEAYFGQLHVKTDDPGHPDVELSLRAYMTCSRPPVAQITAPLGTGCPCTDDQVCVASTCHAAGIAFANLGAGAIELSGETSYDLTPDAGGTCTKEDPAAVTAFTWSVLQKPEGATAAVNPSGKVPANKTTLSFDTQGWYQVGLVASDKDGMSSAPVSFNVYVDL